MFASNLTENRKIDRKLGHVQKCRSCSYISKTPFFMRNHLECHTSSKLFDCGNKDLLIYQCKKDCNFKTNLIVFLKQHLKEFHKMVLKDYENSSEIPYKIQNYVCDICKFTTYSLLQLLKHKREGCRPRPKTHEKIAPKTVKWHKCDQCAFKTKRKCYLKTHSALRHSSNEHIQFFQCEHCPFQTKWKIGLRKHILYKHTAPDAVKWHPCDQCPYKAKTSYDLSDHRMWKHTSPEQVTWFQCPRCPYRAKKKSKLKQHESTQHVEGKDIKWLECDQCDFKAKAKSNLRAHKVARHTATEDIKWFECDMCAYKGRYRRKLERHVATRHGGGVTLEK